MPPPSNKYVAEVGKTLQIPVTEKGGGGAIKERGNWNM